MNPSHKIFNAVLAMNYSEHICITVIVGVLKFQLPELDLNLNVPRHAFP